MVGGYRPHNSEWANDVELETTSLEAAAILVI